MEKSDKRNIEDIFALTPMQEGMLFHYLKDTEGDHYFEQLSLEISGEIHVERFRKAWNFVIETNEMLRAVFRWEKVDRPVQIILKNHKLQPGYYDLSVRDVGEKNSLLEDIKVDDRKKKFDLQQVPFRVTLCRIEENKHLVIISNHHILYDGWSNGILLREFFKTYNDLSMGKEWVKPVKTKFKEFVKWIQNQDIEKQEEFWRNYLKDVGTGTHTGLAVKRKEKKQVTGTEKYSLIFERGVKVKLEDFVKKHKVTLASCLYCVWGLLLQRYNNSGDVIFGTTVSGRSAKVQGIEEIVGLFINTLPYRVQCPAGEMIEDLLCRIDSQLQGRGAYETTPLVSIKEYSEKESTEELFDTIVVIENYPLDSRLMLENSQLSVNSCSIVERTHYDLTLGIALFEDLQFNFTYNTEAFDEDIIVRLAGHFCCILEDIVENPGKAVHEIELLSEEEKKKILLDFNDTAVEFPAGKTLHELFEEQAVKTPDGVSVVGSWHDTLAVGGTARLTYKELNRKSGQLARSLREKGVLADSIAAIMVHRSIEMIIGILGILKAGGAYLPIDPNCPQERIEYMLKDSGALLLVTTNNLEAPDFPLLPATGHRPPATSLAYVIYTSGSTGRPKGVMVEHGNVVNAVTRFGREYDLKEGIHVIQISDYTFDASVDQIFGTLLHGTVLFLVNRNLVFEIQLLRDYIKRNCIHVINFVPALLNELLGEGEKLASLRTVISGAERLDDIVKDRILRQGYHLYNHYGPTETTIDAVVSLCTPGRVHLGHPISNVRCYILDNRRHLLPIGIPGELYISGAGVSRGYLNRPGLTADRFVDNPFLKGKRMYRSGDLCRWLPDGNIEFLGRLDLQVKIRGFRIELEEIENRLLKHEQVKEAVVVARENQGKGKYLCAYIVPAVKGVLDRSGAELREYLSRSLPDYMVPGCFVTLAEIPLTSQGKIDRNVLPEPEIVPGAEYTAPRNPIETSLIDIWHHVLEADRKRIGIDDNFFHLGGHSLKAIGLIARINREFNVELSISKVFETPTIRGLAQYISKSEERLFSAIEPIEKKEYYALSSAQKRLFILHRLDKTSIAYNMCETLLVEGMLEKKKLEKVFRDLIIRHESLRTSLVVLENEPVQRIHDEVEFGVESFDLAPENTEEKKQETKEILQHKKLPTANCQLPTDFIRPFDLSRAPLLRVGLIHTPALAGHPSQGVNSYILMVDMHHIISDGVSAAVFVKEFMSIYKGERLPALRIHYKDFAEWQNSERQKEGIKRQEQYWIKEFEREIPVLNLPADYRRPEIYRFEGSQLQFRLERTETRGLKTFALRENATLFMVLLAGYNVLLSRLSSQEDIIVGSPAAGRRHADLEPVMGFFINTLPLRNFPAGEKTFKQFIEEVKQRTLQAFVHQDYPYEELVEKVAVERDTSRNPLFDTLFSLQNFDKPEIEMPGLRLKPYDDETRAAKFDLTLQGWEREGELWFILEYNTNLFKKETIRRFIIYFRRIISSLLEDYSGRLGEIEILPGEEKKKILYDFNDTAVEYPQNKSIHELFEEQAEKTPDHVAVVGKGHGCMDAWMHGNISITFRELNEKSNQAAYWLREKGVLADSAVAIMMERSIEMIIGIIGILKSGAAYMPIDPGYPQERIDYILKDSGAKLLVTTNNLEALDFSFLPTTGRQAPSTSLAYVIYTSGSGGKPKGVMVEHSSVVNVLSALQAAYPLGESDTYLFKTSYIFDVSVAELFGWFWSGGRLAVLDAGVEKEPGKIIEAMERQCVTHINFVPSMFSVFMEHVEQSGREKITRLSGLKYIFLAGEALLPDLVERFNRLGTGIPLENIYGPTEASVYSSWYSLAHWDGKGGIPIGKPMPNIRLYILDNAGGLQPIGIPGELCISGAGVARGYLNNPELTAEKFIYYRSNRSYRTYSSYKTGDLARRLVDGSIEFLGRMDFQVKIRGFRIELGEIESRLLRHPGVKEAVVVTREVEIGDKYLCAYIVPGSAGRFDIHSSMEEELRDHLSASLPGYMIPAYFVPVDKIPHTPSGKVDRKALPEPGIKSGETYVAPGNEIEERLAVIWAEVLGCEKRVIGINDHFFKIGGHSLKAVGLINRIHKEFSIEIPLVEIFRTPTIRGIGRCIQTGKKNPYSPIGLVEEREYYELSSAQERLFVLQRIEPDTVTYNIFDMMIVEGRLERDRFEDSVKTLIKRHESLRTSFEIIDEVPVQRIHDEAEFEIEYFLAPEAGGTFIRPFDFSTAPLLRMGLIKIGNDKHILMVDMHHIISDGVSIGIFIKEFGALYMEKEMPGLRVRYRDFSYWQNRMFTSPDIEKQRAYWRGQFEGEVPVLNLPYDFPRPLVQRFEGARIDFDVASGETGFLKQSVLKKGTTTFIMLLAVLNVFLSKLSSQEDITVGVPTAGRNHPDLEGLIGMFVNTLPLRTIAAAEKSFGEFAEAVEKTFLAASERQDYPYEELVENLALKRDVSRNPLYDVVFALENNVEGTLEIPGLKWTPCEYENRTAKFDLTLLYIDMGDALRFTFEYSTALFKEATIHRFIRYFRKLLANILESGDRRLWELEIIPDQEKKQILLDFNATVKDYPQDKTLHELFEEQAAKTPDGVSVVGGWHDTLAVGGTVRLTYKELNRKSGQLAHSLREKGVLADSIAAIMVHRSIEMIIGILGILKAGGAYLPIDPDYPWERIDYMLKESGAKIMLVGPGTQVKVKQEEESLEIIDISKPFPSSTSTCQGSPANLAYVIYTSGTTGRPRGVMVEQRNVVRLVKNTDYIEFRENDRLLPTGALEFDASTFEIWGSLLNGLTLFLVPEDDILNPGTLKQNIRKYGISTIWLTSPLFNQLCGEDVELFAGLKNLLVGGDVLSPMHIDRVRRRFPGLTILNGYGPTENTTFSTVFSIEREYEENIPIGQPIANSFAYIVDKYDQLVPIGVVGELVVGGDGVARGYMNNPGLTAEKFRRAVISHLSFVISSSESVTNDQCPMTNDRLYRTGDLARWLSDGNIEFLGRRDHQVKIRGFRVETGEIENYLLAYPGISEAVVIPVEDNNGDKHLCAYIIVSGEATVPGVRDYLSGRLPGYMVPSYFLPLERIPLTPNGKVDRRALPLPAPEAGDRYAAPRDEREKIMTSLWAEVLGIEKERIGIDDDFFQLGGHSLKAVRITGRVHKTFDIELPVSKIFEFPTIRELAQYINRTEKSIYSSIEPAEKKEYYALSSAQKRLFILQQMDETSTAYNVHDMLLVEGILQEEKLADVFRELIARHESLRTSFCVWEGESVQKIHDHVEFEIEYFSAADGTEITEITEKGVEIQNSKFIIQNSFIRPFDLSRAPLLRVGLIHTPPSGHPRRGTYNSQEGKTYILMVDMHHIISDGLSVELLVREFALLFKGETLPELSLQYKDFSEWQNRRKEQKIIKQQEAYWLKEFESGIPLLKLPQDFPRPEVYSFDGSMRTFKVEREETAKLRRLAAAEECTLFMLLLSSFYIFISKLTSQEDMVVGTPVVGRRHPQLEGIIGMFVNTLALRNQPIGEKNLKEFFAEVKDHTLTAFENQDYPFEDLVDKVVPRRVLNRNALFDVMFSLQSTYLSEVEIPGLKLSRYEYDRGISKFDLLLSCDDSDEELNFTFEYNTTLFKPGTVDQWIIYFKRLVTSVCAEPGKRIADIEIMTAEEKKQLMFAFYDDDAALLMGSAGDGGYEQKAGVYTAPRDELEMKLVDIWTEILGIEKERIGIDFSFFDLGGHSYSATIMVSKIHKALAAKVTLVEVFKRPHIRGIAEYIRGSGADAGTDIAGKYASVELVEKREYYPLSSAQQRLFLLYQVGGAVNTVYNLPVVMMVEGRPDKQRFENVFHLLIKRHESLRTSFHVINGESAQRIHDEVEFAIEYFSAADDAEILPTANCQLPTDFIRPFELSQAPLMRVGLVTLEAEKHLLIFDMHHIISDAVSMRILVEESIHAYEGKPLPEISIQYKDFAHWQNRLFERDGLKKQEEYWLDRFKGDIPVLKMPGDYARPVVRNFEGDNLTFYIDKDLTGKIKHILSRADTTLYIGLLAVYFLLLYKYTEQEDIIVGIAGSGRNHADIENVIGVFINTLAIRAYPTGDKTFGHFLEEVKVNALSAYDHQDYPFETLVDRLGIPRDFSRNPLVDVLFISENVDAPALQIEELKFTPYEFGAGVSHLDLVLLTVEEDDKIRMLLEYSTALFKRSSAEKISQRYIEILEQVTANPRVKLKDIEISVESGETGAGVNIDEFVDFDF